MKKSIALTLFSLMFAFGLHAQLLSGTDIMGTWKIVDVQIQLDETMPPDAQQKAEMLKAGFLNNKLVFGEDNKFSFDTKFLEMGLEKGKWKYDPNTKGYDIREISDVEASKGSFMLIYAKKENGKMFLLLHETPIVWEVEKM